MSSPTNATNSSPCSSGMDRRPNGSPTETRPPGGAVGLGDYTPRPTPVRQTGLTSAHLTLTIGFGPSLFGPTSVNPRRDRFRLAARKPHRVRRTPDVRRGEDRDLTLPTATSAFRRAPTTLRWRSTPSATSPGSGWVWWRCAGRSSASAAPRRPRLRRPLRETCSGSRDGTNNLHAEEPELLDKWVWVDKADNPPAAQWMTGGTYLVARRIRMDIEPWDRANLLEQEQIVGRLQGNGAPLGQHKELTNPTDITSYGVPLIPKDAHVRLAHEKHIGVRLLRRGYNFTDGSDGFGHLDAGLFFIAFNRNTAKQFVPMQQSCPAKDAMTEYLIPNASATFAIPPGLGRTNTGASVFSRADPGASTHRPRDASARKPARRPQGSRGQPPPGQSNQPP